jgi:uncharacterized protein (DUF1800 family)
MAQAAALNAVTGNTEQTATPAQVVEEVKPTEDELFEAALAALKNGQRAVIRLETKVATAKEELAAAIVVAKDAKKVMRKLLEE